MLVYACIHIRIPVVLYVCSIVNWVYPIFMIVLWRQKASACVFATHISWNTHQISFSFLTLSLSLFISLYLPLLAACIVLHLILHSPKFALAWIFGWIAMDFQFYSLLHCIFVAVCRYYAGLLHLPVYANRTKPARWHRQQCGVGGAAAAKRRQRHKKRIHCRE